MKKYIVLSVNDNQDYLYFLPLTVWAWRQFGWESIVLYQSSNPKPEFTNLEYHVMYTFDWKNQMFDVYEIEGYRSDTITQISRLYGSLTQDKPAYIMTGDIDLIPLSDYWHPRLDKVTVYGHDLTGYGHYPICFIGMPNSAWTSVMNLKEGSMQYYIKRDLETLPQAKDPDFYKYWFTDQDLITQRLNEYGKENITFINRGQGPHGFARGRVDRGSGGWVLNQPELIDAHLEQQTHHSTAKINRLYELLAHVWPGEDFAWFKKYTEEFRKLTGHTG